jgi:hypothetical protein
MEKALERLAVYTRYDFCAIIPNILFFDLIEENVSVRHLSFSITWHILFSRIYDSFLLFSGTQPTDVYEDRFQIFLIASYFVIR